MKKYNIIIKTGEAEIRAIEHLPKEITSNIHPIIELTRGRKITKSNNASYPFDKRLEKIKNVFEGQDVCVDVTSDPALSSPETYALYNPKNGYENWVSFLLNLKEENRFANIVPTILWNFDDQNFEDNIKAQIESLTTEFGILAYRNSIEEDSDFYEDIETYISDTPLLFILDCEYVPMASCQNVAQRCIARLNNLKSLLTNVETKYILAATSYPNNVTEFGNRERDELKLSEICLFNAVKAVHSDILYGDYGSIFPKRNDTIVMARGWVPKIDVCLSESVFYHRQKRPSGVTAYADTYIQVAKSCVEDPLFPKDIDDIWGIRQIHSCALGSVPSSSPSFWISVRMNTHIVQRLYANSTLFR